MSRHGLALPKAKPAASPAASTSAPVATGKQGGSSDAANKPGGVVMNPEEAVKHYADGSLQELIAQAKQGGSPGTSNAASPAASNATGEDGAVVAKGLPTPTLQNMVATVDLGTRLDLKSIALHARNAEYNPKRFAAVIMRIREPKTTALVFASGKMVVTGAKSEDESKLAARKFARIIQKLGFDAKFQDFKIQNVVGSVDVKFPIRLEGLAYAHGHFSSYEPELFPGLIYRMVKPRVVLLIFVSGKVVLTGARTRQDVYTAFQTIYPVLAEFRKSS